MSRDAVQVYERVVMYDSYIVRRTQIYLSDEQAAQLDARARSSGRTRSDLIRDAIDGYLASDSPDSELARFRAAVDEAFGIAPYLPSGADYVDQIRPGDPERVRALWED